MPSRAFFAEQLRPGLILNGPQMLHRLPPGLYLLVQAVYLLLLAGLDLPLIANPRLELGDLDFERALALVPCLLLKHEKALDVGKLLRLVVEIVASNPDGSAFPSPALLPKILIPAQLRPGIQELPPA